MRSGSSVPPSRRATVTCWCPRSRRSRSTRTRSSRRRSRSTPPRGRPRTSRAVLRSMGAQLRMVRRRIRSVQSTAKITRAQELIASSRIIRAQQRLHAAAPYARELTRSVEAVVSMSENVDHPLTRPEPNPRRAAVVLLTSDRGFCGGFNANLLREAQRLRGLVSERGLDTTSYVAGRKGIIWHRFRQMDLAAEWSGFSDTPRQANAAELA